MITLKPERIHVLRQLLKVEFDKALYNIPHEITVKDSFTVSLTVTENDVRCLTQAVHINDLHEKLRAKDKEIENLREELNKLKYPNLNEGFTA